MARNIVARLAFNRGIVSKLALARLDLARLAFSAETMTNWVPRVLGSMTMRPGLAYIGGVYNNSQARFLPFIFSTDDTALIEITDGAMRVWVGESPVSRVSVSSTVTNGDFTSNLTGWTDSDEAGATSAWLAGGYMQLTGNGTNAAIRDQTVTVSAGDKNKMHALRIVVSRGPVTVLVGSSTGAYDYIAASDLDTGEHSLAFTPSGDFSIRFMSILKRAVLVDSVAVEGVGDMVLTAPWATASLGRIQYDQSGDIIFIACRGYLQRKIERRGAYSWSLVRYLPNNGPFQVPNTTPTTLTAGALNGNTTLTASRDVFALGHVGVLFRVTSSGQRVSASIAAQNVFTTSILVDHTGEERRFTITLAGTWSATVTLQRSVGDESNWSDVNTWTANVATTYNDLLDNQTVYYRVGVKTGGYTSGTVTAALDYPAGSISGVCRVTDYTSSVLVGVEVLVDFGSLVAEDNWAEGVWSTLNGFPTAVAFYEGRLWWAGPQPIQGSVSDDFYNYDSETVGDSGPINRTIGAGPVDDVIWLMPVQRLIAGAEGAEFSIRPSSFDEFLTPSNFNVKPASTIGSAGVTSVRLDSRSLFVGRGATRLYELAFDGSVGDYASTELTLTAPDICEPSIIHLAAQRHPDTRVHCVRSDGRVAMLIYNPAENVLCWVLAETDGVVEDVVVLPGTVEDTVYYVVRRNIGGSTVRYLERWSLESEAQGGVENRLADAHVYYSGVATTTISGLGHLNGEEVVVWGNGMDLGTKTVSGGQVTGLSEAVTTAVVGLAYTARWKSTKLINSMGGAGVATGFRTRISQIGLILADTDAQGLRYGPDFATMDSLPLVENSAVVGGGTYQNYAEEMIEFPGEWSSDSRLCLQAQAPRPATVLACLLAYVDSEKS